MYTIRYSESPPPLTCSWNSPLWDNLSPISLSHFRPEGSGHQPETQLRLLFTDIGISGLFRVKDRYIRCTRVHDMDDVWKDSCVELFIQPKAHAGYFNFEFNCGGAMLGSYITNPERTAHGFREFVRFTKPECARILRGTTMPRSVDPEIAGPEVWHVQFFIPFALLETYVGPLGMISGQTWRANAYKCGDETSHPHWGSWQPLPEKNFHLPECFGTLIFSGESHKNAGEPR